ncbi:endonuclease/exonuclease/phosphatase family protein [Dysgonomonas macrotermitis]|uniref:Endonuclease/Exonuclease/phosphatase family protein n=1 Tax=Dysgonomonas macrotermitis TaxID=1346286 RepID=A0A1M4YPZ7_9BACT|nr:endonuclease [Dysgonomonas macrotermitis]SHF07426.1 Endonuclease/Exonuclease/phosphatase family protein [Dysgonomonas macrotermitis]
MIKKLLLIFFACVAIHVSAQTSGNEIYPVAFYNVENLFDTQRDYTIQDEDFTSEGKYKWTEDRYKQKLNNLAEVISQLGREQNKDGFAILGVAEVENRKVMQDLISKTKLSQTNYQIVHQDSPDARGIDVGLIYNPKYFKVISYKVYPFTIPGSSQTRTRDILVVSGLLAGEPFSVLVNHWPSRRGEDSSPLRERAASICKHISDSIYKANPAVAIVIMGDMNDDPKDKSTSIALGAKKEMNQVKAGGLFNTLWKIHESGKGTLCYRGEWNLFDQIIISESLLKTGKSNLSYIKSEIFSRDYLFQKSGKYQGYPLRTFSGTNFLNGYSDHLPTLIYLKKGKK